MKSFFIFCLLTLSFSFAADINVPSRISRDLWSSIDIIGKLEGLPIIKKGQSGKEFFKIDKIECVFESYDACSFFSDINGERKLIVSVDGSTKLINALAEAGVALDGHSPRLEAKDLSCSKGASNVTCLIIEY